MKRAKTIYSGTLNATKAAEFFDRMHALKDALEQLQAQYAEDIAEVVTELSDAQSIDPALIRMAFAQERQKRKREAKIAKMDSGKACQLDLLADAAAGSEALGNASLSRVVAAVKAAGPKVSDVVEHLADEPFDAETGEILETELPETANDAAGTRPVPSVSSEPQVPCPTKAAIVGSGEQQRDTMGVTVGREPAPSPEIPSFLRRKQPEAVAAE